MSEIVFMEGGGWNLQEVLSDDRALSTNINLMSNNNERNSSFFAPLSNFEQDIDDFLSSFPEPTRVFDCDHDQPFYNSSNPSLVSSSVPVPHDLKLPKPEPEASNSLLDSPSAPVVQHKRRKNRHKMVVQQVTAEGLSSDKWAWRKYGQKPIKGSPYPRSYYRCSSTKGCMARKQVERNPEDPNFYIITYTADHSHTHPTRKSVLAGTTRNNKASKQVRDPIISPSNNEEDEESIIIRRVKEEMLLEEEETKCGNIHVLPNSNNSQDIFLNDELFPSLEDMERLFLDQL
ncbi:hypothetical protein ACFE04_018123 [Oxalis oulophora]